MRLAVIVITLGALAAHAERPKLLVSALTPGGGAEGALVSGFTDALTDAVSRAGLFEVLSSHDVAALLGMERQKALLGCASTQCMMELSDALGARFMMTGSLTRLGEVWQLSLTTLDSQKGTPIGRATRLASSLAALQAQLPYAVAEATGAPPPPSPSRALPITLLAVGGAAIIAGGVLGLQGLSNDATVRGELSGTQLDQLAHYQQQAATGAALKSAGLAALVSGAALGALGVVLWVRTPDAPSVALVPAPGGLGLAGAFP